MTQAIIAYAAASTLVHYDYKLLDMGMVMIDHTDDYEVRSLKQAN